MEETPTATQHGPREPVGTLLRELRARPDGLSSREAERRLVAYGRNEIVRRGGVRWPRQLAKQFTHPLALLLWLAAGLAFVGGTPVLGAAILAVIALNAVFAFAQERQAERAIEALRRFLPPQALVLRDGQRAVVDAGTLVPGDVLLLSEGDRISADGRLLEGALDVDLSTLTGESQPVYRSAELRDTTGPLIEARDLVFSGSSCVGGEASALVVRTGMQTELGRIAALTERVETELSPLERQVRRVAWLIALVAVLVGLAFLPIGWLVAGLPLQDAFNFAIGLIVANVPEGLLPTITLALAVGVAMLARRGALVKRLSAVETLGSADVICTDKTGTLTENRMRAVKLWTPLGELDLEGDGTSRRPRPRTRCWRCSAVRPPRAAAPRSTPPTEQVAWGSDRDRDPRGRPRDRHRRRLTAPGAPAAEAVSLRPDAAADVHGRRARGRNAHRAREGRAGRDSPPRHAHRRPRQPPAARGERSARGAGGVRAVRVAGVARARGCPTAPARRRRAPARREDAEAELCLLGLVALFDPPREEVADAVARCHAAGIRIIVVTGDYGPTAAEIARRVGIARDGGQVVTGAELEALSERELDELLREGKELIFARSSPEAKLRIADALRAEAHTVAMTGDGVNDAPALRRADIGIAMGLTGTEVAREAATMVLTDDNFATIVAAVEAGRQVFDNIRKFILYIFAHATPEVVPSSSSPSPAADPATAHGPANPRHRPRH